MQANKDQVIISQTPQEPTFITIYITGTVKNPDVYKIDEGNIIKDAINIAGGALDNADLISVNLARKVQDGEEIIIPFKDENIGINMADNNFTKSQKININTASVEKLKSLPRIGDVKANVMLIP
jgi:competence protein ComEA